MVSQCIRCGLKVKYRGMESHNCPHGSECLRDNPGNGPQCDDCRGGWQERLFAAKVSSSGEVEEGRENATTPTSERLPGGQAAAHWILSEEERAKGFVRPVRHHYKHEKCGGTTRMGDAIAETYAREPCFYTSTFCVPCGAYFPVGEGGQFIWEGTAEKVGT